ncbi:MAG: MFS transporter [Allorhizobium sp.]
MDDPHHTTRLLPQPEAPAPTYPAATQRQSDGRWSELLTPHYLLTTLMLCIGVALYAFNGFLVTTALPSAVAELGGAALISWSLTLYLTASIVAGSGAGLLKQRLGGRLALVLAALMFLIGTLLAAHASVMAEVLVGRVLQGIGEGIVAAICYALIPEMFPSKLVPKVFGAEAGVWAIAAFGGPLFAGYLTETLSWRAAFLVNVPIIAIFIVMAITIVPGKTGEHRQIALPGLRLAILAGGFLALLLAGLGETAVIATVLIAASALAFVAVFWLDRRALHPILPTGAFSRHTPLGLGLWVVLLMPVAQATGGVYIVYALQNLWGFGPMAAGGISAVMAVSWSTSAIIIANVRSQRLQKATIWIGPIFHGLGCACLFAGIASGTLAVLVAGLVLNGCAFGLSWGFLSQMLMEATPLPERDKTSTLLPTLQSSGFALGAAIAGFAANAAGLATANSPEKLRFALMVAFLFATLWALPAFLAGRRAVGLTVNTGR